METALWVSHVLSLWAVVGLKSVPHRAFWRANLGQAVLIGTGPVKGNTCVKNRQLFSFNKLCILHVSNHTYQNSELE